MKKRGKQRWLILTCIMLLVMSMGLSGCSKAKTSTTTGQSAGEAAAVVPTWDQLVANKDSKIPGAQEVSGHYSGVMVITDLQMPQPKNQGKDISDSGEACGYAMMMALKDVPLPVSMDLQVGSDGKGTLTMTVQGLTDKEGSKPEAIPVSYANGKLTMESQSDPKQTVTQDLSITFLNKQYKQALTAKAGDEKTKGKSAQDEITQLKAKIAAASESEKAGLQQELQQKESQAKYRDVSSSYMEQMANSSATLVMNGSFSTQSSDQNGVTSIKCVLSAVNATVAPPQMK
ncbi:MAG TPA: hypothetical protein VN426_11685 [Syntrophomonadaceae bacterium]|nr:hypothetical protein [Syntrophomonadaceae bacterium]